MLVFFFRLGQTDADNKKFKNASYDSDLLWAKPTETVIIKITSKKSKKANIW